MIIFSLNSSDIEMLAALESVAATYYNHYFLES